ncbi:unnamed protein product [Parnassius mnemosyne]|uniref:Peptidase S1 domain-containing protein n=1 Tax=Parnassius mnemosyne TaxID=213953 RepID=A0AAV1KZT6_9NEOP
MNKWSALFLLGVVVLCNGREPFRPREGSMPFVVYFLSRYRGLCVGALVSRTAVITAAVCVTNPLTVTKDTRHINVIAGTTYRHLRRGIRVPVTKIIIPKWTNATSNQGYLMQKSPAVMLLKHQVPDVIAEVPLRGINIAYQGEIKLTLHEECLIPGYHFFYKGDKITQDKFLLQRNMRVQFMNVAKKYLYCDTLEIKFQQGLIHLGFEGHTDKTTYICIHDPDRTAQPCHGMYGAPLICQGKVIAMLMAPDAQWTNCTGFSNIVHLFSTHFLRDYMDCVSSLFSPEFYLEGDALKRYIYDDKEEEYDYLPEMYDTIVSESTSTEEVH